jgi:hypothetical protein
MVGSLDVRLLVYRHVHILVDSITGLYSFESKFKACVIFPVMFE